MIETTTPDAALLWARRKVALAYAGEASASFVAEMATGGNDNWVVLVTAEAFRAGHSHADAGLLAAVREARDVFQHYGDLHVAKPDPVKAQRNYDLATKMSAAIAAAKGTGK